MGNAARFKTHGLYRAILAAWAVLGTATPVMADQAVDLGVVGATGTGAAPSKNDPDSATYQAPTQASLTATQPQSIITQHYIEENTSAGSNYSDIISIAPSVVSINPNGPGMMETQSLTIRGFSDGQYNVTFDGIPWGDSNDFTHHSTSYFMPQDIGGIVVDRGPGDASNIGNATFGGTVAVTSKLPSDTTRTSIYGTTGSWNTNLFGAQFDTGNLKSYNDTRAFIDYKNFTTDGYLTNSGQRRQNVFMKFQSLLGDETTLSFVAMGNKVRQNVPYGATTAQMALYGNNFALDTNPGSQNNAGYNYDDITSDFEYLGLKSRFGSWSLDNKLYTYSYYHNGYNTNAPGALTTGLGTVVGGTAQPNDVPGQSMTMNYRSYGDLLRMSEAWGKGTLDLGMWVDYQTNSRSQYEIDWTLNQAFNTGNGAANGGYIDRLMGDSLTTIQPYIQYTWNINEAWSMTPGLKYDYFRRAVDSTVNQGTGLPYSGSASWEKALPAFVTRYMLSSHWSVYAQYAQGFMAPNLNVFYKQGPQVGGLSPQETTNYQVGTTWSTPTLTVGFDLYKIDFTNQIAQTSCGAGSPFTCFYNAGGVKYNGGEVEATWAIGGGVSLYGNYGVNNYSTSSGSVLPDVPQTTAAAGVIYQKGGLYSSLIAKEVGSRYADVTYASGAPIQFGSYTITNFNLNYKLDKSAFWGRDARIGFQVNNLFNQNQAYFSNMTDPSGNPMFFNIPERNYEVSLAVGF
ncbi:MAG: TonB-dependent receptor [Betaproteobacteria bacterium]|nr:TonB-dependent receptor [Betaproteobacteria bacterium]